MSLAALRNVFVAGCRHVICLDRCHLRGAHPSILLTTIGIDQNNSLIPLVLAVVEVENKDSWKWLIQELLIDLKIYKQGDWVVMSDRQKVREFNKLLFQFIISISYTTNYLLCFLFI